jgi:hypothetical protein
VRVADPHCGWSTRIQEISALISTVSSVSAGGATRSAGEASAFRLIFAYLSNPTFSLLSLSSLPPFSCHFRPKERESSKISVNRVKARQIEGGTEELAADLF